MKHATRRICALLLAVFLAVAGACTSLTMTASASPDAGGRVPYRFHLETLHTTGAGGSMIQVVRKLELELGQPLEAAGWMATDEGISDYLYMWVPSGGSVSGTWEQVTTLQILPRPDLTAAGIEYPSGHSTAGFQFTIEPPEDLPEGYYDIYIRALDGMGIPCDLAAILNLRYGKPDATLEDVIRVCKAAHIHGYISRLPQGYDTVLSDNGTTISKGQKQLLTIARAMLMDTPMLILDEATSNVDSRTEKLIQDALYALMKGRTCFVIAHRLSTITGADCILVMDKGRIVESGTHQELLAKKGMYYELYHAQFDRAE